MITDYKVFVNGTNVSSIRDNFTMYTRIHVAVTRSLNALERKFTIEVKDYMRVNGTKVVEYHISTAS